MRKIILLPACLTFFCLAAFRALALNPGLPPSGNFDLTHWKLQMPIDASGTNIGNAAETSAALLVAGFTNAFFYTGSDGAMAFWTPDNGAKTSGSTHPRSELRELLNPNDGNVNWTVYGTHILTAQCKVTQVPADTGKVCIGQIHEPKTKPDGSASANNEQMIMFDLGSQKIYVNINLDGNLSSNFSQTLISGSSVTLNSNINYTMLVSNGVLKVSVNNVTNSWNFLSGSNYQGHIAQNWDRASSNTAYFKAGDYNQTGNACNCATDGAKVSFYSLTTYHAPSLTNQPANRVGVVGGNATFTVSAIGNGNLSYQWWLNGTNVVSGATNASLTLSNLSGANVGNYTVVVSDDTPGFNSVTSSVATLTIKLVPAITTAVVTNKTFQIKFTGTPSINYWVQARTNLEGPGWLTIATNIPDSNGVSTFIDAAITNYPSRFYRVVAP